MFSSELMGSPAMMAVWCTTLKQSAAVCVVFRKMV